MSYSWFHFQFLTQKSRSVNVNEDWKNKQTSKYLHARFKNWPRSFCILYSYNYPQTFLVFYFFLNLQVIDKGSGTQRLTDRWTQITNMHVRLLILIRTLPTSHSHLSNRYRTELIYLQSLISTLTLSISILDPLLRATRFKYKFRGLGSKYKNQSIPSLLSKLSSCLHGSWEGTEGSKGAGLTICSNESDPRTRNTQSTRLLDSLRKLGAVRPSDVHVFVEHSVLWHAYWCRSCPLPYDMALWNFRGTTL